MSTLLWRARWEGMSFHCRVCFSQERTLDGVRGKEKRVRKWHPCIVSAGTELGRLVRENKVLFLKGGVNHKQPPATGVVLLQTEGTPSRERSFLLTAALAPTGPQAQKAADGAGASSSYESCAAKPGEAAGGARAGGREAGYGPRRGGWCWRSAAARPPCPGPLRGEPPAGGCEGKG